MAGYPDPCEAVIAEGGSQTLEGGGPTEGARPEGPDHWDESLATCPRVLGGFYASVIFLCFSLAFPGCFVRFFLTSRTVSAALRKTREGYRCRPAPAPHIYTHTDGLDRMRLAHRGGVVGALGIRIQPFSLQGGRASGNSNWDSGGFLP